MSTTASSMWLKFSTTASYKWPQSSTAAASYKGLHFSATATFYVVIIVIIKHQRSRSMRKDCDGEKRREKRGENSSPQKQKLFCTISGSREIITTKQYRDSDFKVSKWWTIWYLEIWYCLFLFIISLAKNILEVGDIILRLARLRFKTISVQHKEAKMKTKQYDTSDLKTKDQTISKILVMKSKFDFLISWLPDIAQKYFYTPDGATDPIFQMRFISAV